MVRQRLGGLICPMHVISPDFDVTFAVLWLLIQNEIAKTARYMNNSCIGIGACTAMPQ